MNGTSKRPKAYQFTKDNIFLTDEQRDFYEVNGYVIFRKLVDEKLIDECTQRFIDICNNVIDKGRISVVKDVSLRGKGVKGEYLINKIYNFHEDDILLKYVCYKPMIDIVESIIGPNITSCLTMLINKPPQSEKDASRHPLHQDLYYFNFEPANSIVTTWTAMEKVDENNGCLYAIPGTHKWNLMKHEYPPNVKNLAYHGILGLEQIPTINLVMEKGDTVLFHPLLLHGSGPNLTQGFRKALSGHYADSNCVFYDAKGTLQEKVSEELLATVINEEGPINFETYWKNQSYLVRGEPGNFQKH